MARHSADSSELLTHTWAVRVWTSHSSMFSLQESRSFLDCQRSFFTQYADWANLTVRLSQLPVCTGVPAHAPDLWPVRYPLDHPARGSVWASGWNRGRCCGYFLLTGGEFSGEHRLVSRTETFFIRKNVDPCPFPAGLCLPVEYILVRPRLVPDLLYPQHHLFPQTSQILP